MGEIMIKNDSFIQSIHNDIQCIESLDEKDKGTSRQYRFSASMLANIVDISKEENLEQAIELQIKTAEEFKKVFSQYLVYCKGIKFISGNT